MAYRIANELEEANHNNNPDNNNTTASKTNEETRSISTTAGTTASTAPTGRKSILDEDEEREAVFFRLEGLGYRVGLGLVERYVFLYTTYHLHTFLQLLSR